MSQKVERDDFSGFAGNIACGSDFTFHIDDLFHVVKKPWVNPCQFVQLVNRYSQSERVCKIPDAVPARYLDFRFYLFDIGFNRLKSVAVYFEAPQCFLQGFLKGPSYGHGFTNGLHLGHECRVRLREFLKRKARVFHDNVVNGGFK